MPASQLSFANIGAAFTGSKWRWAFTLADGPTLGFSVLWAQQFVRGQRPYTHTGLLQYDAAQRHSRTGTSAGQCRARFSSATWRKTAVDQTRSEPPDAAAMEFRSSDGL